MNAKTLRHQIGCFLRTGDYDLLFRDWPGQLILIQMQRGHDDLLEALVSEIRRRQAKITLPCPSVKLGGSLTDFAREKLAPMVHGLFPRREWAPVLALLEKSVVFLSPNDIESVIRRACDLDTAWEAANLYLTSVGAKPLNGDAQHETQDHRYARDTAPAMAAVDRIQEAGNLGVCHRGLQPYS